MLDHVAFAVPPAQYDSLVAWYVAALAPLGYTKQVDIPGQTVGIGPSGAEVAPFWIAVKEDAKVVPIHLAFKGKDHATVDQFHAEAIKAGGKCNGEPGPRLHYHPNYYGAFVLDPVG
jgi:hypothetical protein